MPETILKQGKILIIDDEKANVRFLEVILQQAGYSNVYSTTDSRQSLALFRSFQPDIVLLDLAMPHMDGFAVMQQLQQEMSDSRADSSVPILVLTADAMSVTKHKALKEGARDFLTKPLDETEVLLRINNLLETRFQSVLLEARVRERTQELEAAQQELQKNLGLLQAVMEGTTEAIFVKDREGRYLMINTGGAGFLGRTPEELLGREAASFFDPDMARLMREGDRCIMESGRADTTEETGTAGGVTRSYLVTKAPYRDAEGNIIGIIGISRDITEQKRLQEQMIRSDRLAAMGELAAGVAHEINNPLAVISGHAQFLQMHHDPQVQEDGGTIRQMAARVTRIVNSLLTFARQSTPTDQKPTPLRPLIEETLEILRHKLRKSNVEVILSLAEPDLSPTVNAGPIEQVLLNLIGNAEHALRQREKDRKITITTHSAVRDDVQWAVIRISDNGCGIPDNVKSRIFDPFFTTKPQGEGTGLGLSICHGIVKEHQGQLEVESQIGVGTTFTLSLPLLVAPGLEKHPSKLI